MVSPPVAGRASGMHIPFRFRDPFTEERHA